MNALEVLVRSAAFVLAVVLIFSIDRHSSCSICHGQGHSKDGIPCVVCRGTGRVS